jgi:hypothetical protein
MRDWFLVALPAIVVIYFLLFPDQFHALVGLGAVMLVSSCPNLRRASSPATYDHLGPRRHCPRPSVRRLYTALRGRR